jgi:hypothetical protein
MFNLRTGLKVRILGWFACFCQSGLPSLRRTSFDASALSLTTFSFPAFFAPPSPVSAREESASFRLSEVLTATADADLGGAVVENALLAVQNDLDAMGATHGVKADMVETNVEVAPRQLEARNPNSLIHGQ